ncbi:MAG: hypothetical protein ABIN36_19935 [Ferruginibacter sp.]
MNNKLNLSALLIILSISNCNSSEKNGEEVAHGTIVITAPTEVVQGKIDGIFYGCGFDKEQKFESVPISLPGRRELNQIHSILNFSGLSTNFEIFSAPIQNAMATVIDGKRYILYDPKLLQFTDMTSGSYWSSMSILAHEIGHHLSGHTISNSGSKLSNELEADVFSGFVLYKLGATLDQASAAIRTLGSELDTKTHPAKAKRLVSIEKGWRKAYSQRYQSALPPTPTDDNSWNVNCGSSTFDPDILIGGALLSNENSQNDAPYDDNVIMEGIIVDIAKLDKELAKYYGFLENDFEYDYNLILTIELTKVIGEKRGSMDIKPGNRLQFHALHTCYISNVFQSCFNSLITPGRKIRFKSYSYRRGVSERLFFVKKLDRDGSSGDFNSPQKISSISDRSFFVVDSEKAYFHNQPIESSIRKAYLVHGESGSILKKSGNFIYVEYENAKGITSKGWILLSEVRLND